MSDEKLFRGKTVIMAPSLRHVKALQNLLLDKIGAGDAITLKEAQEKQEFPEKVIFVERANPLTRLKAGDTVSPPAAGGKALKLRKAQTVVNWGDISPRSQFFADHFFILNDHEAFPTRDQTGWKYGDRDHDILSEDVLQRFHVEYENLGETL